MDIDEEFQITYYLHILTAQGAVNMSKLKIRKKPLHSMHSVLTLIKHRLEPKISDI